MEVTWHHFHHTLMVEAVTSPLRFKERDIDSGVFMGEVSKNLRSFKISSVVCGREGVQGRGEELHFFEPLLCAQHCVVLCGNRPPEVLSLPLRSFLEEDEIQTERCA